MISHIMMINNILLQQCLKYPARNTCGIKNCSFQFTAKVNAAL